MQGAGLELVTPHIYYCVTSNTTLSLHTSHIYRSHVTHKNESFQRYEGISRHTQKGHCHVYGTLSRVMDKRDIVTCMTQSRPTHEESIHTWRVNSHMKSQFTHVNKIYPTYRCIMSHIWMSQSHIWISDIMDMRRRTPEIFERTWVMTPPPPAPSPSQVKMGMGGTLSRYAGMMVNKCRCNSLL